MERDSKGLRCTFDGQITLTEAVGAIVRKAFRPEAVALPDGERFAALGTEARTYRLSEPYRNDRGIRQQDVVDPRFLEEGTALWLEPVSRSGCVRVFGQVRREV